MLGLLPMRSAFLFRLLPAFAAIVSLSLIALLLFSLKNPVSLDDGLRHFAMARLMSEQGIHSASWGQFFSHGYFAHHTVDPWFLSNLAFVPLLPFGSVLALKVFALIAIAFLIFSFLYAFHEFHTPLLTAAIAIVLLLFFEPTFLYRLLLARPYELVTPLAVVIVVAAMQKRPMLVGAALMLCVLLSQVCIFPIAIALVCVLWRFSLRQWEEATLLLSWVVASSLAGLFFHPHPIAYLFYLRDTFIHIPFLPGLQLGSEMHSGLFASRRVFVFIAVIVLLHGGLTRAKTTWKIFHESGLSLLAFLTVFFLALFLLWERAIDFLWPMTILLLVRLLSVRPGLFTETLRCLMPRKFVFRPVIGTLIVLLLCGSSFVATAKPLIETDHDRALSLFTEALSSVPRGSTLLNVDWHFFMGAVEVRPDLQYATGIDPSYTYLDDPKALELLSELNTPKFQSSPTPDDVHVWLREMTTEYPSDFLILFRSYHAALTAQLETELQNLSTRKEIAVFSLSSSQSSSSGRGLK